MYLYIEACSDINNKHIVLGLNFLEILSEIVKLAESIKMSETHSSHMLPRNRNYINEGKQ